MALNLGQREDLRKLLLDMARLIFAIAILGPLARPEALSRWGWFVAAFAIMLCCVIAALQLHGEEAKK